MTITIADQRLEALARDNALECEVEIHKGNSRLTSEKLSCHVELRNIENTKASATGEKTSHV